MKLRKHIVIDVLLLLAWTPIVMPGEGTSWRKPRQQILDVLHAEDLPTTLLSPTGEVLALMKMLRYPPLADLAQPTLRLAGVRLNPRTNGRHAQRT